MRAQALAVGPSGGPGRVLLDEPIRAKERIDIEGMKASDAVVRHHVILADSIRPKAEVILVGDSITENLKDVGKSAFDAHLQAFHPTLNGGVGGDTAENVLWRIDHGLLDGLPKAKLVVIRLGVNDIGRERRSPQATVDRVDAVLTAVKKKLPNAKILLDAILPAKADPQDGFRGRIAETNRGLQALAERRRIPFFDPGRLLLEPNGWMKAGVMQGDQLHPASAGYEILARALKDKIHELIG